MARRWLPRHRRAGARTPHENATGAMLALVFHGEVLEAQVPLVSRVHHADWGIYSPQPAPLFAVLPDFPAGAPVWLEHLSYAVDQEACTRLIQIVLRLQADWRRWKGKTRRAETQLKSWQAAALYSVRPPVGVLVAEHPPTAEALTYLDPAERSGVWRLRGGIAELWVVYPAALPDVPAAAPMRLLVARTPAAERAAWLQMFDSGHFSPAFLQQIEDQMAHASTDPNTTERPGVIWRRQLIEEGRKQGERAAVLELARELDPVLAAELSGMDDPAEMRSLLLAYLQHR